MVSKPTPDKYNPFKREITIDGETYDIATKQGSAMINGIVQIWLKLGKPDTPLSDAGEKLVKIVMAMWEDLEPVESALWYEARKEYQLAEKSVSEQIHTGSGRSLASYPYIVYQILKTVFPKFKFAQRESVLKLVKKYPFFQMAVKA